MASLAAPPALYGTTTDLISRNAFEIVVWVGLGVCATITTLRMTTRIICFRALFLEDYLILATLAMLIAIAGILQHFLPNIYYTMAVQNGRALPGLDFPTRLTDGLRAGIAVQVLSIVGIWFIKLNFLIFFHRLGRQIRSYQVWWWVAFGVVIACGITSLGIIPYDCSLGDFSHILMVCSTESSLNHIYTVYRVSIAMDVISDAIIICFPIVLVWKSKINLRQKLLLTGVFLLVVFNIIVTIIRGSIFGGIYNNTSSNDRKVLNVSWMLFWFYLEYITALIVACLISFRSLWISRKQQNKSQEAQRQTPEHVAAARQESPKPLSPWGKFQTSLLDTLHTLEGTTVNGDDRAFIQLNFPSSRMRLDFSRWGMNLEEGNHEKSVTSTQASDAYSSRTDLTPTNWEPRN
ncbi:hypothetical protein B0I35DRAFT_480313 [Stachybotrys elegans]|uniref:Rhodopsin domain-containing protein n=1 Tax=Stachybotrys elegans TaxID=80388 RepID=A0A8K0WPS5_9HYPO|nr:hypothetical protein B0I35DRAFT_480313 [Stachybotrys elegans]